MATSNAAETNTRAPRDAATSRARWEARVRQRATDLACRYPGRAAEIVLEMLERLEHGRDAGR